jgi:hypothetical protein
MSAVVRHAWLQQLRVVCCRHGLVLWELILTFCCAFADYLFVLMYTATSGCSTALPYCMFPRVGGRRNGGSAPCAQLWSGSRLGCNKQRPVFSISV